MSRHLTTTAVRRRWRVCESYVGGQELNWPPRAREKARAVIRGGSTHSYLALDARRGSRGLELAIVKLLAGSPERSRQLPIAAVSAALEPVRPAEFDEALARLEEQGVVFIHGDLVGLAHPVQHLDLGLIPRA
jgi:hypothetical protein